jgi:glycosyltransferase involved in cell wall biosynthesis
MAHGETISLVIPTYNRRDMLEKNLKAIAAQSLPLDKIEVIIICDGGTDNTEEMVRAFKAPFRLRFFRQKNHADVPYNVGARMAECDFILFLDDDVIPHRGMLEAIISAHNRFEGQTAIIGRLQWPDEKKLTPFERYVGESGVLMGTHKIVDPDDVHFKFALGGNFSVTREIFQRSGGFDSNMNIEAYGNIDIEFGYRLKKQYETRLIYEPGAAADHWYCSPFPRFCEQRELAGATAVVFYKRHPELSNYLKIDLVRRRGLYAWAFRTALGMAYRFFRPLIPLLERNPLNCPVRRFAYRLCIFYHYQKGLSAYLNKIKGLKVPPFPAP